MVAVGQEALQVEAWEGPQVLAAYPQSLEAVAVCLPQAQQEPERQAEPLALAVRLQVVPSVQALRVVSLLAERRQV